MGTIYFQTTAFNAEKTLARCVDSVLNQTCGGQDIVYYLCDNGSTDRTGEMVRAYAASDPRVRPFFNRKNRVWEPPTEEFRNLRLNMADDDWLARIDADDEYDRTFLEKLLPFAEDNRLDIAVAGVEMVDAATGDRIKDMVYPAKVLMTRPKDFADHFSEYHWFMRAVWGKLCSGRVMRHTFTIDTQPASWKGVGYGSDTLGMFDALRHSQRMGMFPEPLYRYAISHRSVSSEYSPDRFDSNVVLYNDAVDFLSGFGPISETNRIFLGKVYANAVFDTARVVRAAALAPEQKLRELRRITGHPVTQGMLHWDNADTARCRQMLWRIALDCGARAARGEEDLSGVLRTLKRDDPLLYAAADPDFLRRWRDIALSLLDGRRAQALDAMTGWLLDRGDSDVNERFLQLYLSLAAMENQALAFAFGKMRLARLYLRQGRREDCRVILDELTGMGVDNADIGPLRRALDTPGENPP